MPPFLWQVLRGIASGRGPGASPALEIVDYYANASLFAIDRLRALGDPAAMRLFSLGSRILHLADYVGMFSKVYHATMVDTVFPFEVDPSRLAVLRGDVFELAPFEFDCVISHSTIHCLSDSRYGNVRAPGEDPTVPKPYRFAAQLRRLVGSRRVPAFLTVAVNHDECFTDNNSWLSHERFVRSFLDAGFELREHFFDFRTGGVADQDAYNDPGVRRSPTLPKRGDRGFQYVAGTYHFT